MISWKIPTGFAGFGAFVSLLAGIIGGNPFGVVLLRLILSAGFCGGLGFVVNIIVKKYLLEHSATPPVSRSESGEEVDIVIDEDIPLPAAAGVAENPNEVQPDDIVEPLGLAELAEEGDSHIAGAGQLDESEEDVSTLENAEPVGEPVAAEPEPVESAAEPEPVGEPVAAEPEPIESAATEPLPEEFVPGIAAEQVTDFEDLDTLPDIDQFSPTSEDDAPASKPSRRNSKVDEVIRDQDPENLARAVRTFMKKDQ